MNPIITSCGVTNHSPLTGSKGHGVSTTEIYRALATGELPGRKRGRAWIIRCTDLETWINNTSTPNTAEIERGNTK